MSKPTAPARRAPVASVATTSAVTLLTLFAATESRGVIITNTDLGATGFTRSLRIDDSVSWDIDADGVTEVQFSFSSYGGLSFKNPDNSFEYLGAADGALRNLALLPLPETISNDPLFIFSPNKLLILGHGSVTSPEFDNAVGFTSGEKGYIGFRYETATTVRYGWASVTFTIGETNSFTLHEWAYEDSRASIQVGQTTSAIPEPANVAFGLGALALGAAGLMRWRKRKAA